jgi:acyl-CoA synthetase (NDP forming)
MLDILEVVLDDNETDGVIFIAMFASANLELTRRMAGLLREVEAFKKPVICCFTAPPGVWDEDIEKMDGQKGVAIIHTPERAARAMANLWRAHLMMERELWRE